MRSGLSHKHLDMNDEERKSMEACKEDFVISASILCGVVFAV